MNHVINDEGSRPIKVWTDHVEDAALRQLKNIARLPFVAGNGLAVMPDVHMGKGAAVGSVIATDKALIPSAVGVDIGCGMNAVRLSLKASDLPESLKAIRNQIERDVPLGAGGKHRDDYVPPGHGHGVGYHHPLWAEYHRVKPFGDDDHTRGFERAWFQLGSLGSGNHFIELCIDENEDVWVMLHSGSRGTGNEIGRRHIEKAKENMERFFISLPDADLAYIPEETEDFNAYVEALNWAQNWALENRRVMMVATIAAIRRHIAKPFEITHEAVNCHHNYVEKENHFGRNLWVTRKGAIRARKGDLGIIPGSMGTRSYIVRGKGNPESYCSCSHGAGRRMSRTQAEKTFTVDDLKAQTEGIECRKDSGVLDELPAAYKDIDAVMAHQQDLVEVVHTLRQVLCVKGN
jgi:tRNA-splicing ligase RtcB